MDERYLIRFCDSRRYLKSFTMDEIGDVDEITTTAIQDEAMHLELDEAIEYKSDTFKFLKPELVEEGTFTLYIPTHEEYRMMYERRLEHSTNRQLWDEILSRIDSSLTVNEIRKRLGFCFGNRIDIHYTDNEKEVEIEDVFKALKNGGRTFINEAKRTQYRWQCNEHIEVVELGKRPHTGYWIHKRYVLPFKYNTPLEMLKDKDIKFPITGYKEGYICENVFFGNTHDSMERQDNKTIIKPLKSSEFKIVL